MLQQGRVLPKIEAPSNGVSEAAEIAVVSHIALGNFFRLFAIACFGPKYMQA
jgi:hypothetical protein